jgi:hypothetical protein
MNPQSTLQVRGTQNDCRGGDESEQEERNEEPEHPVDRGTCRNGEWRNIRNDELFGKRNRSSIFRKFTQGFF